MQDAQTGGTEAMKKSEAAPFFIQRPYPPPPKPVTAPSRPFPKACHGKPFPFPFLKGSARGYGCFISTV